MEKLYSDHFAAYDRIFDKVCDEFSVNLRPSWHHRWFYRFLQISISYYYVWGMEQLKKKGIRRPKNWQDHLPDFRAVNRTFAAFGDVWSFDLAQWWFYIGQFQFIERPEFKLRELARIPMGYKQDQAEIKKCLDRLNDYIDTIFITPSHPDTLILGIPLNKSKKKLLEEITIALDRNTLYPQNKTHFGNFFINKTKLKEKTLKDCYRVLEIQVRNPEISLIELAKLAGTLQTSLAGLNSDSSSQTAKSVRSGISRQLNLGLNIAENAARGIFPDTSSYPGVQSLFFKNNDLYQPFYQSRADHTLNESKLLEDLRRDIPYLISESNKISHDIKRLY